MFLLGTHLIGKFKCAYLFYREMI